MTNQVPNDLPPLPQHVVSDRLIIRPTKRKDASCLQKWWNDPAVMAPDGNPDGMQYDDSDMEDWLRRYVDGQAYATHFVICLREPKEKPIGEFYIACDDRPGCVDIALAIGETTLWGRGYGSEAVESYAKVLFASSECNAVRLDTRRDNSGAIHMAKKVGFVVEHVWANGEFQTMLLTKAAYELRQYTAEAHS
ncbi:MAG: GNAT family N-acetyltransferase [Anaerolineae bacterium]|nr:GNAT family N-acetyltransferase [Anaerolineae bacterium]